MRDSKPLIITFVAAIAFVGCSLTSEVVLLNNTGVGMFVRLDDKYIAIDSGQASVFDYYRMPQGRWMRVVTAVCEYAYEPPQHPYHYPWSLDKKGPLRMQIEKDFFIYLSPPAGVAIATVADLRPYQQDEFPLHPVSKSCR